MTISIHNVSIVWTRKLAELCNNWWINVMMMKSRFLCFTRFCVGRRHLNSNKIYINWFSIFCIFFKIRERTAYFSRVTTREWDLNCMYLIDAFILEGSQYSLHRCHFSRYFSYKFLKFEKKDFYLDLYTYNDKIFVQIIWWNMILFPKKL